MISVPLRNDNEYYTFDFDALSKALLPDTKLFYLCNPQNPVGRIYTHKELQEVSSFAKENDLVEKQKEIMHKIQLIYHPKLTAVLIDKYINGMSIEQILLSKACDVTPETCDMPASFAEYYENTFMKIRDSIRL